MFQETEHTEEMKRAIEVVMRGVAEKQLPMMQAIGLDQESKEAGMMLVVVAGLRNCALFKVLMDAFQAYTGGVKAASEEHHFPTPIQPRKN